MRNPGCLLAIVAVCAFALFTGFCSFTTFSLTQQTVIDLNAAGFRIDDPLDTLRCLISGQCTGAADKSAASPFNGPVLRLTPLVTPESRVVSVLGTALPEETPDYQQARATPLPATAIPTQSPASELPRITDPRQMHILLMGIDQRSATGDRGPFRTDTMMLLSVNPARKTVGVLSLPRDLYVNIPDFQPDRINKANFIGDANAYPGGGGPALAMETIAENFGVRIEKYLLVNFDVFTSIVDTLAPDGVPIMVTEFIDDPDYPDEGYGTLHVQFEPGELRMDAETLLQYARTRATQGGDFDRARRQQQVLDAVRAEVLSAGGIANFVSQAFVLWDELQSNYRTNLEINDVIALARLMGEIEREDIRFEVIDNLYVTLGKSPQGDDVLYPDYGSIRELIVNTFYPPEQLSLAELKARADEENALVYVYNGTEVIGLAGATREWLNAKGVRVDGINNDVTSHRQLTEIRDYGRHNFTAQYLAQLMGLPADRIMRGGDGLIAQGVLVALGEDAQAIISG